MKSGRNAQDETWATEDLFDLIQHERPELYHFRTAAMRGVAHRTWCFAEAMCLRGDMPAARAGLRNAIQIWRRMACKPKVWGLWAATYTGYRWFAMLHARKQWLANAVRRVRTRTAE
jgi:hypothetical protein